MRIRNCWVLLVTFTAAARARLVCSQYLDRATDSGLDAAGPACAEERPCVSTSLAMKTTILISRGGTRGPRKCKRWSPGSREAGEGDAFLGSRPASCRQMGNHALRDMILRRAVVPIRGVRTTTQYTYLIGADISPVAGCHKFRHSM
jgi:hypothetical protein